MAGHAWLKIASGLDVYFCDPHTRWQRRTSDNIRNMALLSQCFLKAAYLTA